MKKEAGEKNHLKRCCVFGNLVPKFLITNNEQNIYLSSYRHKTISTGSIMIKIDALDDAENTANMREGR